MKKILFLLLITTSVINANAQLTTCDFYEDYSSSTQWTTFNFAWGVYTASPDILIQNGTVDFNNVRNGDTDARIFRPLGRTLCNFSWVADFEFTPAFTSSPPNDRVGQNIFCLTAGSENPTRDGQNPAVWYDQDGINILYYNDGGATGTNDCTLRVEMKDGTVMTGTDFINAPWDGDFNIRLERIDGVRGRLTVVNKNTNDSTSLCFDIPKTIKDLTHLQHANYTRSGTHRRLVGTLDNVCIYDCQRVAECCFNRDILGPTEICFNDYMDPTATYSITNDPAASYTWIVSGATFSGQGSNSIEVTYTNPPVGVSQFTVQLIVDCNCFTDTLEKIVTIYRSPDPTFSRNIGANGNIMSTIALSANNTASGAVHTWEIWKGVDCTDPLHPTTGSNPLASGTGTTFNTNIFAYQIKQSDCIVIIHSISFPNSSCPPSVSYGDYGNFDSEGEKVIITGSREAYSKKVINSFELYPNPTRTVITISSKIKTPIKTLRVLSMDGDEILKKEASNDSKTNTISVEQLAKGQYIIEVQFMDGSSESKQFVKN